MTDHADSTKAGKDVQVLTFGCRLNTYESQIIRQQARLAQLDQLPDGAVVVNTCTVTGEAVRQAKQAIRKVARNHPHQKIIVTGCAAQTEPDTFAGMEEVDLVIGNDDKLRAQSYRALPDFGLNSTEKVRVNDIQEITTQSPHLIDYVEGNTRAFVQVQNGCDHRCTFCVIPYGRGPSRSVPAGSVVDQIKRLVDTGHLEVVLTGVDTTSWGGDLPGSPKLGDLVQSILRNVPDLKRLRLSSIDSIEVDEPLFEIITGELRFMPHLHLSLQSGDDMILKRMKRRHSRQQSVEFCQKVLAQRPDMTFGADLIAGFPTETDRMFENTLALVKDCGLTRLHVFPFSPRPGTPAARMPQLDRSVIKMRAATLRHEGDRAMASYRQSQMGMRSELLVETHGKGYLSDFSAAKLDPVDHLEHYRDQIVGVKIIGDDGRHLRVRPIDATPQMSLSPEAC